MYISGQMFVDECIWNIDNRYPLRLWTKENFKEGDSIFLKISDIPFLLHLSPPKKAVLIIHNSDETFTDELYNLLKPFATTIYAVNCQARNAIQIPLGFRDDIYTPHSVIEKIQSNNSVQKDILCLVNFSLETNMVERVKTLEFFKQQPFCHIDGDYFTYKDALSFKNPETIDRREKFYKKLQRSRFVICPPGTGVDTHRVYESIIFGAIPIVKKSFLDPLYLQLPVLIVNDWVEVTEHLLVSFKHQISNVCLKSVLPFLFFSKSYKTHIPTRIAIIDGEDPNI